MDAVVDQMQIPAGWALASHSRSTPPLGLCAYSVQACPSTQLTYAARQPAEKAVDLETLLPDAEWLVEQSDCSAPAAASGSWTSCDATTEVDGFTVRVNVGGATFDDEIRMGVSVEPSP